MPVFSAVPVAVKIQGARICLAVGMGITYAMPAKVGQRCSALSMFLGSLVIGDSHGGRLYSPDALARLAPARRLQPLVRCPRLLPPLLGAQSLILADRPWLTLQ